MNIELSLAGIPVRVGLRFPENARSLQGYITAQNCLDRDVFVPDEEAARCPTVAPEGILNAYAESYLLIGQVSRYLLPQGAAVYHAVAIRWQERAWLFAASSGVGKTTQLRHWLRLYGEEIQLINGDKPILRMMGDGTLHVSPSPWNGKENYSGNVEGTLGGIVLLRQADTDRICRLPPDEAAVPLLQRFLTPGETEQELRAMCRLTETILNHVPVWMLENQGGEESARLTHDTLRVFEGKRDEQL